MSNHFAQMLVDAIQQHMEHIQMLVDAQYTNDTKHTTHKCLS
jgi:hypothetical protein